MSFGERGRMTARASRYTAAIVIGALAALTMVVGPASATASPSPTSSPAGGPQLSIAVDDLRTSVSSGDQLTYATTVTNLGLSRVRGLALTQTVPAGLTFGSADSHGAAGAGTVRWTVTLAPSAKVVVHTTMTVTATPKDLLRLATVACATTAPTAAPIVCASDSDQLPAGAAAASATATPAATSSSHAVGWVVVSGIVVLLALATAFVVARRRASRAARDRSAGRSEADSDRG
jgi:uncharacterized repeat protein (TIGR01451 family)